jgi:short subunit dehydrogenase-like uncharacterized protein
VNERSYDVVLYGATGFTGTQATRYLAAHAPPGLRWAIAGRNPQKLEHVAREQGLPDEVGRLVADSTQPRTLAALAEQTQVVATTAGPFARYGDPVVEACVDQRTDYVDITGETPWVRTLIDRFHERARDEGTRIVPLCGFDSIPSDLGAWMVARWIRDTWGQETRRVQSMFSAGRASVNGGTLASVFNMAEAGQLEALNDVLLLNPKDRQSAAERERSPDRRRVDWDGDLERWLTPFVMAPINTRVVRRSNALFAERGEGYGSRFSYHEAMGTRGRLGALAICGGSRVAERALRGRRLRGLAQRFAPAPGQGPSEEQMQAGWFRVRFVGEAEDGRKALGVVSGEGDPGNRATVRMLCESALCLALDRESLPKGGGLLTPACSMGSLLVERLRGAGMRLTVESL